MRPAHVVFKVPRSPAELTPLLHEGLARECVPIEHDAGRRMFVRAGSQRVELQIRSGRGGDALLVAHRRGPVNAGLLSTIALASLYGVFAITAGGALRIVTGSFALLAALALALMELHHWAAARRDRDARFADLATTLARIVAPLQLSEGTDSPYREAGEPEPPAATPVESPAYPTPPRSAPSTPDILPPS